MSVKYKGLLQGVFLHFVCDEKNPKLKLGLYMAREKHVLPTGRISLDLCN